LRSSGNEITLSQPLTAPDGAVRGWLAVDLKVEVYLLSGYLIHADSSFMKWLTSLLSRWIFGNKGGTIRIDPDHLPGLRAPKAKPRYPVDYPRPKSPPGTDIDALYRRFYKSQIGKLIPIKPEKRKDIDFE
jgi:hypothetical protein